MSALAEPALLSDVVLIRRWHASGRARRFRLSLGLSVASLADAVGVSETTYAAWESGATLRARNARAYAGVLADLLGEVSGQELAAILEDEDAAPQ
jgi:transcriptional regulator with XRE-family HTH domain